MPLRFMPSHRSLSFWVFFVPFALLTLVGWYLFIGPSDDRPGSFYNKGENAVWLEHSWIDRPHSVQEIRDLVEQFGQLHIRSVYVHVGPVESDGMIPAERYPYAAEFLRTVHAYTDKIQFLAWIGQVRAKIPYEDSLVRHVVAETARFFVREIGFDGIHYDIEPIWDSDTDFLFLLEETRELIGEKALLSVALREILPVMTGRILSYSLHLDGFNTPDFYQRIADRTDQIVLMTYENSIRKPWLYRYFVKNEVIWASRLLHGVDVLIGLPTYDTPSLTFYPEAENIRNGLVGLVQGLNNWRSRKEIFSGVALYRYGTTDESEWRTYEELWGRKRSGG